MFPAALEAGDGAPGIVCLLAEVISAKGGRQHRGIARDHVLHHFITPHLTNTQSLAPVSLPSTEIVSQRKRERVTKVGLINRPKIDSATFPVLS